MRPKNKLKSDDGSPRTSVDATSNNETQHALRPSQKSGAFSYLKTRLFHAISTPSTGKKHDSELDDTSYNSPTASIEKTVLVSGVTEPSPNTLDIPRTNSRHRPDSSTILSKSFEPTLNQEWERNFGNSANGRPVSVLGLEEVVKQIASTNGNAARQSELENLHARQLSAMITPVKQPNTISKSNQTKSKRFSAIVIKEGYLFKKTDFKTFSRTARLDRSWKGYHIVLRGHKLYLYRAQHENQLKPYFPSPKDNMSVSQSNVSFGSQSLSSDVFPSCYPLLDKGMAWDYNDFDLDSQTVISTVCHQPIGIQPTLHNTEYLYGDCFTEVDQITGAYKGYFCLLIFKSRLLICKKDWPTRKSSPQSTDLPTTRNDRNHSGTKWNVDVDLSLDTVALSHLSTEVDKKSSEEGRPGVIQPLETEEHGEILSLPLPLKPRKSSISLSSQVIELDISPTGHVFLSSRQFIPSSTSAGKCWIEHFTKAKKDTTSLSNTMLSSTTVTQSPSTSRPPTPDDKINKRPDSLILKECLVPTEYFDYRDIQGGTVNELFRELLRIRKDYSETGYVEFVRAFLLTYPLFTTSSELIASLKRELAASASDPESGECAKKRAYQITQIWCEDFKADVVGEVATGLLDTLDMDLWKYDPNLTSPITLEAVSELKKMVLTAVDENAVNYETSVSLETEILSYDVGANTVIKASDLYQSDKKNRGSDTIDVANLLNTGFTPSLFLQMDPAEFARQLYLFHKSSYRTYKARLMNPLCYIPQSLPSTTTPMHLLFTTSSPHFITNLVSQHILIDSHQMGDNRSYELILRAMLIEHWIRVGEELMEIGDMCGWCAIAVSICSFAILRLKQSWKFVNQDLVERVRHIWSPVLIQSNMFSTDIWVDDWQHYSTRGDLNVLDTALTGIMFHNPQFQHIDLHYSNGVPFFGVIRQFVERLRRHVNRYLNTLTNPKENETPIVNFERYWSIYDAVWCSLQRYQSVQKQEDDDHVTNLSIVPVGPLQAFFEHTHVNLLSVPNDYNVLQECSLECEPKPFLSGGSIQSQQKWKAFNESVASSSSWILSFPQLVSTIKLSDMLTGIFHPSSVRNMKIFQPLPAPRTSRSKKFTMQDTIQEADGIGRGNESRGTSTSSMQESNRSRNRKRTYSFPSARSISELGLDSSLSAVENMESNSRSWVNPENYKKTPVVSKSPFHAISHVGAFGEKLLSVRDGELILQVDVTNDKRLPFACSESLFNSTRQYFVPTCASTMGETSVTWTDHQRLASVANTKIEIQQVTVKAGTCERLIDVLIYGLSEYSANVDRQDEFGEYVFSECRLSVDMEEYVHTFFVTYRSFLSSTELLEHLRKSFMNASSIGRITKLRQKYSLKSMFEPTFHNGKPMNEPDISDWTYIARVRLQIFDLIIFWVDRFFWDFVDDNANRKRASQFIQQTAKSITEMRLRVGELIEENAQQDDEAESVSKFMDIMENKIQYIHDLFLCRFVTPTIEHRAIADLQATKTDRREVFEKCSKIVAQVKFDAKASPSSPIQSPYLSSKPASPQKSASKRHMQSVMDQLAAPDILQQADSIVQQIFKDITLQDWIILHDALVSQCIDPYSWLPVRKGLGSYVSNQFMAHPYTEQSGTNNVVDDEIVISDIFIAIQGARRSTVASAAYATDNLLSALPDSIQQIFELHFSIRSWVINELMSFTIDCNHRAERIQKCLDIIVMSRLRMSSEPVFKEFINNPDVLDPLSNGGRVIPGFVEYSILSALVSPQVRLFVKSWSKVADKNQAQTMDTLETIVDSAVTIAQLSKPERKAIRSRPYVISLGWILEMMLDLCEDSMESLRNNQPLLKFDQCRYVFNFLRFTTSVQELVSEDSGIRMSESGNFTEKLRESLAPRLMDFLTAPTTTWPPLSWKELRDFAYGENMGLDKFKLSSGHSAKLGSNTSHGSHTIPGIGNRSTVFGKLVAKQQEKLKADIKERDRIDREWKEIQHKMQKKQLEQAKNLEKREKKLLKHQHGSMHHHHQSSHLPWINSFLRGLKLTHINAENQDSTVNGKDGILQPHDVLYPPIISDNMKASNVINLINSTSSVASTYLKRDFVFRIVTEEGGQYLFQAMNDGDMHDWIRTINSAAKEGAARRLTVLVAEAESKRRSGASDDMIFLDDRQRKKGKAIRGSVYGVELSELMSSGKIPLIVEKCIDEIERRGLEEVGIYRVAGSGETVADLRQQLNRNTAGVNLNDDDWIDINVVADALKQFFRDLPEPLLTFDRYADFMKASAMEDHDERVLAIKQTAKQLPANNYLLLKRLIEHFVVVTDYEACNHMYATNLAIVFGPTLLRPIPGPVSFATTMANIGHQQNIVKNLITHYHFIFDVESEDYDREPEQGQEDKSIEEDQKPENANNSE